MTSKAMSGATRQVFNELLKKETDKQDEFNDKLRLLMIYILCSSEISDIKQLIETLKTLHKDKFNEEFIQSLVRRRRDFEE